MTIPPLSDTHSPSGIPKTEKLVYAALALAMTVYLTARAILVPMGHDELATFYYFVQSGKVSPFFSNIDTNNHFLNSALTWGSYYLSGPSPLALRLPNLLFIPLFFYALCRLCRFIGNQILRIVFFVSVAFTLHLIEFFALSRGYGMSLALMMASLSCLSEGLLNRRLNTFLCSLLLIFTACLANLALIHTFLLILMVTVTVFASEKSWNRLKSGLLILVLGIFPFLLILFQILYIKANSGLIAGAPENFWKTTILSLFTYLFETKALIAGIAAAFLFGSILLLFILNIRNNPGFATLLRSPARVITGLFFGNILIILILGLFFHVNYPDDRIGTYLYLLALCALFLLAGNIRLRPAASILLSLPFLLILFSFIRLFNFSYSIWYKYDVIPERYYETVMSNRSPEGFPPTVAAHGLRILCWSYLDYRHGGNASPIFFTHFPDYNADFQIVNLNMIPGWQKVYDTVDYDPVSERHLLKKRDSEPGPVVLEDTLLMTTGSSAEFIGLSEGKADSLCGKSIRIDLKSGFSSPAVPLNARIVFDVWDKDNKSLRYEYIQLNWLRNNWSGSNGDFSNTMLVYQVPGSASTYKLYLWNIDKAECSVKGGHMTIREVR
jgi:hypothetical protein